MNKVLLGLILGAILGALDGATSWFTPEVRSQLIGIIAGSTVKGIIAGVAAGWFARKVHNVAAGIVFGVVVGAILAYGIVLLNQGKYAVAIMLPGTCVGAICGWATQRYGESRGGRPAAGAAMLVLLVGLHAHAGAAKPPTGAEAFAHMRSLEGVWSGHAGDANTGPEIKVTYHVTGGGSALQETLFPGTNHEMITMYTLDGESVRATHYCSAGNQPEMRLALTRSSEERLVFDFVAIRGLHAHDAPYIHDVVFTWTGPRSIDAEWHGRTADDKPGETEHFYLVRDK